MRREFSAIILGIGTSVLSVVLPYLVPAMSPEIAHIGLAIGIILTFIGFVMFFWHPKRNSAKWEEPRLDLIPSAGHIIIIDRPHYQSAQLEIVNLEELEITDCYATLVELWYRRWIGRWDMVRGIPSLIGQRDRIKWVELSDSNASCEIRIPAKDSRHLDLADTLDGLGVNLRAGRFVFRDGPDEDNLLPAYTVTIRIDGKFNGKGMKPQRFDGYICCEVKKLRTLIKLQMPDSKFVEEIHEQDSIPLLMFAKKRLDEKQES
jgi:hypothetical protein